MIDASGGMRVFQYVLYGGFCLSYIDSCILL